MKRKFDYQPCWARRSFLFDAEIYTPEQAKQIFLEENMDEVTLRESLVVKETYVKWSPKLSQDEMWLFDIESEDNRGCYLIYDEKIDKGFKVWEVSYEKNLS